MRISRAALLILILSCSCASSGRDGSTREPVEVTNSLKQQAHKLIAEQQYQAVVDVLTPLLQQGVRDPQVNSMLGKAYWKLGAYDQAVENFESALRLDYVDANTHLEFGEMLMEMRKVGRALTEFELAIEYGEGDALAYYNHGLALYEFGRRDAALAQWETAFSLDPLNAQYAEALGIGLTGREDKEALGYFEKAIELGADDPTLHNNLGLLLIRLGRHAEAEAHFETALSADPSNESYQLNLAVAHLKSKDFASAIPLLEEMLAESPDNATCRVYLGRAYYEQTRYQEVIGLLEVWLEGGAAGEGKPDGGTKSGSQSGLNDAYDVLAMSFRGVGQLDKAIVYIGKAVELEPENIVHLNNYGVILAESGRVEEAREQWRKVLRLEPDNAVAKQNLSTIDG
jgi:superkiller protein 3